MNCTWIYRETLFSISCYLLSEALSPPFSSEWSISDANMEKKNTWNASQLPCASKRNRALNASKPEIWGGQRCKTKVFSKKTWLPFDDQKTTKFCKAIILQLKKKKRHKTEHAYQEFVCNATNTRDVGLIPGSGRSPGWGYGNPLQYSCLQSPMDREAWQATVHGVAESWTQLSD